MSEIIKASEYGIEKKQAGEIFAGLAVPRQERALLKEEFDTVSKLEITYESIPKFKALRLKLVKNRTQGTNKWHEKGKEVSLRLGQLYDAVKRSENNENEQMEKVLMDAEKHFENLEKERVQKLQADRVELLAPYVEDAVMRTNLHTLSEDEFADLLTLKRQQHIDTIAAELQAEKDRIAREKAEQAERERIRKENEQLKKEAEERERLEKIEADERAKIESERVAKEQAEAKAREDKARKEREAYEAKLKAEREERERVERIEKEKREKLESELKAKQEAEAVRLAQIEADKQAELSKGDAAKVKDLIEDLEDLKQRYTFKSVKNKAMYHSVGLLIDKVITHINK